MEIMIDLDEYDDLDDEYDDVLDDEPIETNLEKYSTKPGIVSYELVSPSKLEEGEVPLGKVIGHENQKKEIISVVNWFIHSKELKAKGVSITKGIILFGNPGNGKSLIISEIIKYCDCPVFIFHGEQLNVVEGIVDVFKKAREKDHAIIVFDELDLLINKDSRVVRVLQENLDGVESNDDILVLSATNNIKVIPDALLRHERLEKLIKIPYPSGEEALELFKKHIKEFNIKLPDDFDDEEVALLLNNISCAGVKSVVNDLVLRNGFENITSKMIDDSIYTVTDRVKDAPQQDNLEVAIHEAGHAIMAMAFPEYFKVNTLNISGASGAFCAKELEIYFWPYDKIIADIKICMAGVLSQKLIYGRGSIGCDDDLQHARINAYNMLNMCGYSSCWETLPIICSSARVETFIKRRKMERKIESLLKKCEKEACKYIKKHKLEIITLGRYLSEKKHIKSSEIFTCINDINSKLI